MKVCAVSDELAALLGAREMPRTDVSYCRKCCIEYSSYLTNKVPDLSLLFTGG